MMLLLAMILGALLYDFVIQGKPILNVETAIFVVTASGAGYTAVWLINRLTKRRWRFFVLACLAAAVAVAVVVASLIAVNIAKNIRDGLIFAILYTVIKIIAKPYNRDHD